MNREKKTEILERVVRRREKKIFFRLVHEYFIHIKMPPLPHCRKLSNGPWLETMP